VDFDNQISQLPVEEFDFSVNPVYWLLIRLWKILQSSSSNNPNHLDDLMSHQNKPSSTEQANQLRMIFEDDCVVNLNRLRSQHSQLKQQFSDHFDTLYAVTLSPCVRTSSSQVFLSPHHGLTRHSADRKRLVFSNLFLQTVLLVRIEWIHLSLGRPLYAHNTISSHFVDFFFTGIFSSIQFSSVIESTGFYV
jgi:hypothetical protein